MIYPIRPSAHVELQVLQQVIERAEEELRRVTAVPNHILRGRKPTPTIAETQAIVRARNHLLDLETRFANVVGQAIRDRDAVRG